MSCQAPELLAPAGSWDCLKAAVANGADAVYFGLPKLNARIRADNFTEQELPAIMRWLHDRGCRGFLTLNTLVFPSELDSVHGFLAAAEAAEVDAVIVQDLGVALMVRDCFSRLHLHASTQMTLTSPEGLALARELGAVRAVLARELSLTEIEKITKRSDLPVEVFVHGALCVAYSGQCLTSESLGQRSANRGECAQACRMPYRLIVDGEERDLGDQRYLLSPQDLAGLSVIPHLVELGVASFKIEGRLKSPEYVAAVTSVYRRAIDEAIAQRSTPPSQSDLYALEMTFSRGLYPGWLHGVQHQELVHARFGKKRGAHLGRVVARGATWLQLDRTPDAKAGDGIVVANPADTDREAGGFVVRVEGDRLHFHRSTGDFSRTPLHAEVYKTRDPALEKQLRQSFEREPPVRKSSLNVTVRGSAGEPLLLSTIHGETECQIRSWIPLEKARTTPLTAERARLQLGRLGNSAYELGQLDWQVEEGTLLPISELNRMRRDLVAALDSSSNAPSPSAGPPSLGSWLARWSIDPSDSAKPPALAMLCRTEEQLVAAMERRSLLSRITLDFEDIRRFSTAVARYRESAPDGPPLFLATPRIQKPGEEGMFRLIERAEPDGILVRNPGGLSWFTERGWRTQADFSLNAANPVSVAFLLRQGAELVTLSFDLVVEEVEKLMEIAGSVPVEVVLHQHMPMFHMEHCVFAAFLSNGRDYTDCGRPCEKHRVELRDRVGMEHPLAADVGCRNTVYNAVAQSGALFLDRLRNAGVQAYRLDLLREDRQETLRLMDHYHQLLSGETDAKELWRELHATSQFGVTRGTLEERSRRG